MLLDDNGLTISSL